MPIAASRSELAPYAFFDEASEGRRYQEQPHPYRSDFQRDRDRIVHTKAFRRLENKTQVFGANYSDHFRNRLTHTLEVAQIARTLAGALNLNTDLTEVLALSHDIGHPPFSHEGEGVLNEIMQGFDSGFEHNLHALVIVEDYEERYAAFRGLNLTFEVREGIVKHSRDYDGRESLHVDISEYRLGQKPPLEAQIIDLADEIAYNSADLDDGYDSGLVDLQAMLAGSSLVGRLFERVRRRFPDASLKLQVRETIRRLIDRLVTALLEETRRRIQASGVARLDDVRRHPSRLVGFDAQTEQENGELKAFLRHALYDHPELRPARRQAREIIRDLFEYYLREPNRLPHDRISPVGNNLCQSVCNYVAGMTDNYARATWEKIRRR